MKANIKPSGFSIPYQNSGIFRDFVNNERFFVSPALRWKISDRTTLDLDFEYAYDDPVFDRGLTALSDASLVLPIIRTFFASTLISSLLTANYTFISEYLCQNKSLEKFWQNWQNYPYISVLLKRYFVISNLYTLVNMFKKTLWETLKKFLELIVFAKAQKTASNTNSESVINSGS